METFTDYVQIPLSKLNTFDLSKCDEFIAVQNIKWVPIHIYKQVKMFSVLNTEQLCFQKTEETFINEIKEIYQLCENFNIYDYSIFNIHILQKYNYKCIHKPYITPQKEINYLKQLMNTEKTYDIGFCGALNDRRKFIIQQLKALGYNIYVCDYTFGHKRDGELIRCKIILNIHWQEYYNIFESIRCNRLLDAGMLIVSEKSLIETHNYENLIFADYNKLVETIIALL
jgi:hypothetical protein